MSSRLGFLVCSSLVAVALAACDTRSSSGPTVGEPEPGDTRFVTADPSGSLGGGSRNESEMGGAPPFESDEGAGGSGGERSVEEGDIYRPLAGGLLLNLSPYRGLQVIDLSDLQAPRILSRLEIGGTPVELYVSGDRALVLLNDWIGYSGSRWSSAVSRESGGVILSVDLSDPASPTVIDREVVPGWIYRSRLAKDDGQEALYVVSQNWEMVATPAGRSEWTTNTVVQSIHVTNAGDLTPQTRLDLGGWISDIQATPEVLLVARQEWGAGGTTSRVSVVDISRTDGVMVEGDEVQVPGIVASQFNMDLHRGILRVVSGSTWGGTVANTIQTFDASDPLHLVPIDSKSFGPGESLYATLFLGNSAFFVTYQRVDPFHAFEITDQGIATEKSQFIVSGWNDFFRPVFGGTRLVGIGVDDADGRKLAVSLYDITDLENPSPLVQRAQIDLQWSWSEANWDHRAFSVVEGAVSIAGARGPETGLVLLPFSGWDQGTSTSQAGVQLFTFGPDGITARGVMDHGSPVRRSFPVAESAAGNLSDMELSLYSTADPAAPVELGRLPLAPSYGDVLFFDGYAARLRAASDPWMYYRTTPLPDRVEIVARGESADTGTAVASFDVPTGSSLRKVGSRLVAYTSKILDWSTNKPRVETSISSFDLADPRHPRALGTLVTEAIPYGYGGGWWGYYDCFDCRYGYGYGWGGAGDAHAVGNGTLAFVARVPQEKYLGTARVCYQQPVRRTCWGTTGSCTSMEGGRLCTTIDGSTTCSGSFARCDWLDGYRQSCTDVDPAAVQYTQTCESQELHRYWNSFDVHAVEIPSSGPPRLGGVAHLPAQDEAVAVVPTDGGVWLSVKRPYTVPGDTRPYAQHFVRKVEAVGGTPNAGAAINVPGPLLQADGDTLYTRHFLWSGPASEAAVARVRVAGGSASLDGYRRFGSQSVSEIRLDGAGHVLVGHRASDWSGAQRLSILDAASPNFASLSDVEVDDWASLRNATAGRALFQVPGGVLVFNLDDPSLPYPQAYFPLNGWPRDLRIEGRKLVVPAGPYGIYELDLDRDNIP